MLIRVSPRWPVLAVLIGFAFLPATLLGQDGIPDGTELTIPPADRILTLATFWSEAKYNFAFWDRVPDLDWDAASAQYSERALNVESDIQFFRLAIEFGNLLGEAHSAIILPRRRTGMKVTKHDGSQHHLVGIQPTIPMERTIAGIREGRDELLEKALEVIRESGS